ncbi:MAG: glycosyltransferase family 2 protein [Candidatus Saganbacteria bacterium]|nr:glycosyltransferase family 2 protein [Candidatus Saganbacteria bacterium]
MQSEKLSGISAFFPAYNEEQNVPILIERLSKVLSAVEEKYKILIVNDGSMDRTFQVARDIADKDPHVRIINHERNLGYGAAVKSGIYNSKMEYVFFIDGDNQFDPEEIRLLLPYIKDYDLVIGFRKDRRDPFFRKMNSLGWNLLVKFLFRFWVKDVNCAFKLFRRSIFDKIQLSTDSALINTELFAQAKLFNFRIKEVGVSHYPRKFGTQTGAKPGVIFRAFAELFRIYFSNKKLKQQKVL